MSNTPAGEGKATKALMKQPENCVGMVINCSDSSRLQRVVMSKLEIPLTLANTVLAH
jgi:hypothetical protein